LSGFRGGVLAGLVAVAVACLAVIGASAASKPHQVKSKFTKQDHVLLAKKRAQGVHTVSLLIATPRGKTAPVAKKLRKLGGNVVYRHNRLGYLRVLMPVRKAESASKLAGIQAINVDALVPLPDPHPDGAVDPTPQPAPNASTPRSNPYMPTRDTGAAQWVQSNPTLDGRGVTVGILDSGIDLDHPSLNTTSTGAAKIQDWVTYTHPATDGDPTWRFFTGALTTITDGTTVQFARTYTGIPNGSYRIARMREDLLGAASEYGIACGSDLDRDGTCGDFFLMLWQPGSDTTTADDVLLVDSDNDASLADESPMQDFSIDRDIGRFGHDNPATEIRESVPFVVQPEAAPISGLYWVNIGIVSGAHGSHVAGITAGNSLFGGQSQMSGAAPGAKLVSVRVCLFVAGCTSHALIEGMIWVIEEANVDLVNMSIGGLPALNVDDTRNTRAVLYNRLIDDNDAQMYISAGNSGPGVNTIGDPSLATKVMSVGSYIHKETWQKNYGSDSTFVDNLHPFSSRGPTEDGSFKPQVVAPGAAISTVPTWQVGQPVAGVHTLPPGYGMFNGTSMAAPQTAGAAALLVGAAKQHGVSHSAAEMRMAFNSTARFLDGYTAADQGNGLINVAAAWELLQDRVEPVNITSRVRVNTILSDFLVEPGIGRGIFDREGVTLGQSYTRTYTFTRTSGPDRPVLYHLRWVGNDGTFSAQNNVLLRKNVPTQVPVRINPSSAGVHSAVLNLDHSPTDGIEYQTMNTVIVPDSLTAANGFAVTKSGMIGRNQALHYFFRVPAGNPVFKVDLTGPTVGPGTGQVRFLRFHPWGLGVDSNSSLQCYMPPVAGCSTGDPLSRTWADATAGVWEVTVEARRTSDVAVAPFTLTASLFGVSVSPNPDIIPTAQVGVPVPRTYTLTNNFATFTGRAVGSGLGSARRGVFSIAHHEVQNYDTTIPAGTTSFRATIGGPSDPAADLDLFVQRCAPTCTTIAQSADGDSEESVTISNPTAGAYRVVVDGFDVPAGTTTYNYVDVFQNPALGSVSITDADAVRPGGSSWTVSGSVTAGAVPEAGRVLLGTVNVVTTAGVTVGRGDVVVLNVTP
jgi:subtilisin family serine protease